MFVRSPTNNHLDDVLRPKSVLHSNSWSLQTCPMDGQTCWIGNADLFARFGAKAIVDGCPIMFAVL